MEKLISRKEAAKLLGISIATLDAARNSGLISYVQYVQNACTLQMLAFRSISQNAPIVQSQWKKALHTASCEVSELELFRILAGT